VTESIAAPTPKQALGYQERAARQRTLSRVLTTPLRWKTFSLGIVLLLVFIVAALFAPLVAPYDPAKPDYQALLQRPSLDHLFGTDDKGRDIFSRVIYGTRISFTIALVAVGIAAVIGVPVGLFGG
jgi:peptide/nickel transport system permease protein